MTTRTTYVVACLSGHGIAAEVMAEASRALARVSRLHGFSVHETHPPFGSEARTQSGHALPAATRSATLGAQAVLVAARFDPALADVESELDLRARLDRVVFGQHGSVTVLSPLATSTFEWTLARSFDVARASRARVAAVGGDDAWESAFAHEAARHDGVAAESMSVKAAVHDLAFEPERFDVVVTPEPYAEALLGFVAHGRTPRVAASSRLAGSGPSVFAPGHGAAADIAGQGVANPESMLLATALMLGEGLGERRAAETLTNAVLEASAHGVRTPDLVRVGVGATTREYADVVISQLPHAMTTPEFYREAIAG
jgi:isocitrate/isopropylmalate dehydrogenase